MTFAWGLDPDCGGFLLGSKDSFLLFFRNCIERPLILIYSQELERGVKDKNKNSQQVSANEAGFI